MSGLAELTFYVLDLLYHSLKKLLLLFLDRFLSQIITRKVQLEVCLSLENVSGDLFSFGNLYIKKNVLRLMVSNRFNQSWKDSPS